MPQIRRNFENAGNAWVTGFLKSGATPNQGYAVLAQSVLFTETTGAGVYTGSVVLPAGATLVDIIVSGIALWTATTSAEMKVGDATDDDGYFTAVDLKATDLLATEEISLSAAGGQGGADVAGSQINRRYSATARTISGIVTTVGAAGTAGRTLMTVLYVPANTNDPHGVSMAGAAAKV